MGHKQSKEDLKREMVCAARDYHGYDVFGYSSRMNYAPAGRVEMSHSKLGHLKKLEKKYYKRTGIKCGVNAVTYQVESY